jgi:type IV pilus assembly protein PilY1
VFQTYPARGETGVMLGIIVRVQFDEPVGGVDAASFNLRAGPTAIPGSVTGLDPLNWTFTPTAPLAANTTYTVTLTPAITDYSGNIFAGDSFQFVTGN